jgi:hypothetical protein
MDWITKALAIFLDSPLPFIITTGPGLVLVGWIFYVLAQREGPPNEDES